MFKHLFIYMIPAVFLFLLCEYCYNKRHGHFSLTRFAVLGASVVGVFGFSFLPFVVNMTQLSTADMSDMLANVKQIFARMFPFERGLTHSYWAPNVWAMYNSLNKTALVMLKILRLEEYFQQGDMRVASLTGGLVGLDQGFHALLPQIRPLHTIVLSLITSFLVCTYHLYTVPI